ncbi:MAG TPA: hypothetical protein VLK35_17965 [Methylomirabilota bacterium]|nr:hypothetical protein [Methylomirabilota bacterium]
MSPRRCRAARALTAGLLLAAALAPAGCVSLPPARGVTDIDLLVGEWRGQITFRGGPYQLFYLTINPDGTLVAWWAGMTRWGKVTLEDGRARFGLYIWSGNLDYLEGGGDRVLLLKEDFSHWDAIVRPLR